MTPQVASFCLRQGIRLGRDHALRTDEKFDEDKEHTQLQLDEDVWEKIKQTVASKEPYGDDETLPAFQYFPESEMYPSQLRRGSCALTGDHPEWSASANGKNRCCKDEYRCCTRIKMFGVEYWFVFRLRCVTSVSLLGWANVKAKAITFSFVANRQNFPEIASLGQQAFLFSACKLVT